MVLPQSHRLVLVAEEEEEALGIPGEVVQCVGDFVEALAA